MNRIRNRQGIPMLLGLSLVLTACSGADANEAMDTPADGVLAGVCPDPVVIQTDWFPEAEHGATYQLAGDDYTVNVDDRAIVASLVSGGVDTGVDVEVRTGGPAIGYQPVSTQMYTEPEITLGFVSTDETVAFADDAPTIAVLAPLEKNPQVIMWDPATYPDVQTIADLGTAGVDVRVFPGGTFPDVLVSLGLLEAAQIDPTYDGSPAGFVASDGAIAQQAFASSEPYLYEFEYEEWMKPVAFQLVHDAGFEVYSQSIVVRADDLEPLSPCLEELIPIMQQAIVDYAGDPGRVNAMIVDTVARFDDTWVYDDAVATYSIETQIDLGLVGNGPDETVGNLEPDRVQSVIDQMAGAGMDVREGLTAADVSTNRFIDDEIGLG